MKKIPYVTIRAQFYLLGVYLDELFIGDFEKEITELKNNDLLDTFSRITKKGIYYCNMQNHTDFSFVLKHSSILKKIKMIHMLADDLKERNSKKFYLLISNL